ncbi:unnamed protein product [Spirodela intermedia]|uniref:Uncharacterized protein n=1 Tax=Spirodela intermedia TaxID=51605 RepID=A0A7I8LBR0_SPIIN|nr:unnamed protein product [Spirodela intermedia]
MQAGKGAMASAKETAANIAASAQSGMEKTKATVQGKAEKMTAHGPAEKEMAEERKQQMIEQAELNKQQAREQHAAEKERARVGGVPAGEVVGSNPIGTATGTGRTTAAHNPLTGGTQPAGRHTGGGYT